MLLRQARQQSSSCVGAGYSDHPMPKLDIARERVETLLGMDLGPAFDFTSDTDLQARYLINNPENGREAGVVAATIWRLLDLGLTTSITAQLQGGLDTHDTQWATNQGPRQRTGFRSVAALLDDLRMTDPNLENTTVIAHSEFARTPRINGRGGRDHGSPTLSRCLGAACAGACSVPPHPRPSASPQSTCRPDFPTRQEKSSAPSTSGRRSPTPAGCPTTRSASSR